jgi:2-polyprenyl-3-methyl-5-hydroxy-6-metoxy-1,4-benzoquinol methylase
VSPDAEPARDEVVTAYEALYNSHNPTRRALHQDRLAWLRSTIASIDGPRGSGRAVEIGPGLGVLLPDLAERFAEVIALDVEPRFLERARQVAETYPNIRAVAADATTWSEAAGTVDLLVCSEVIEHVPEPARLVAAAAHLLRPGGSLVLTTPQRWSLLETTGRVVLRKPFLNLLGKLYGEPVVELGHISTATSTNVCRWIEQSGLQVDHHHVSGPYIPGIAEALGTRGLRLERWLERHTPGRASGWLWTQYWCAHR